MKKGWKRAALAAAAAGLSLALAGCSLPMTGFADYDVSGYFQALLDSSYKGENTSYMAVAAATEEVAQQNNTTTVANAAVNFCNTYGLSPSDDQLTQLEDVMRQALRQADYTVKDEQKVDGGYYLEVEIDPIVNFSELEDTISQLRTEAEEEATLANSSSSQDEDSYGSDDSTYGYDGGSYGDGYDDSYGDGYGDSYDSYSDGDPYGSYSGEDSSSSDGEETSQVDSEPVDANSLFVDKVVAYCQEELSSIRYGSEPVTIALDIRQTDAGELQLDTNQLDTIDKTVLQLHS